MQKLNEYGSFASSIKKADVIIGETDGGMVPILSRDSTKKLGSKSDLRKTKTLVWKEAKLSLARGHKTIKAYFQATMDSREKAGKQLAQCALLAGQYEKTKLHCLGDGAPWIAEVVEEQFGADATYLIDFYHLASYISKAAQCIYQEDSTLWIDKQKQLMRENKSDLVIDELTKHISSQQHNNDDECHALKCFNYMDKRRSYFNYKHALDNDLPIGSGEIESGIRSVVQSRLKIPGAWWLMKHANAMLGLKVTQMNGFWGTYWDMIMNYGVNSAAFV